MQVLDHQAQDLSVCPFSIIEYALSLTYVYREWDRINSPGDDQIVLYRSLPKPRDSSALSKLAVLKVNGGLRTSMGMRLPCQVETL